MAQANENQRETYERCLDEVLPPPSWLSSGVRSLPVAPGKVWLTLASFVLQVANHVVQALLNQKVSDCPG